MADHGRAQGARVPRASSCTRVFIVCARSQQQMCLLVREALSVGKMAIAQAFFSTELAKTEAKMRIRDELSSYCVVTEAPKTTFGKVRSPSLLARTHPHRNRHDAQVRTTYTGKLYGKQDDLAIAIQLALIGCQKVIPNQTCTRSFHQPPTEPAQFFQEPRYRNFRAEDCA